MRILAIEKEIPGITSEEFAAVAKAEARRVWELIQDDLIREIYFKGDQDSAVILLECESLQEARQILETLPMVAKGLIEFDLHALRPYPGLARLFPEIKE
jgi:hypothetical protein